MAALRAAGDEREPRRPRDGGDVPPLPGPRADPALGRLPVLAAVPVRGDAKGPRRVAGAPRQPRPPVHRHRRPARPRRAARRALGAARGARGPGRHHRHQRRPSGPDAGRARSAAARRRRRMRGADLHGGARVGEVDRHARDPGPDGLRGPRRRRAGGPARARGDPLPRGPASLSQPDRPRSGAGAARAAAGAGPPPRLLHRRGRDLRGPALRWRGSRPPSARSPTAT